MPTYSAECVKCGLEVDYFRPIKDFEDIPFHCGQLMRRVIKGPQIIKDIEPYQAVAADVDGRAPVIKSRREHKEFLKRNNYIEVGNEKPKYRKREALDSPINEIKEAIQKVKSK